MAKDGCSCSSGSNIKSHLEVWKMIGTEERSCRKADQMQMQITIYDSQVEV